jgi:hypothetical protein
MIPIQIYVDGKAASDIKPWFAVPRINERFIAAHNGKDTLLAVVGVLHNTTAPIPHVLIHCRIA